MDDQVNTRRNDSPAVPLMQGWLSRQDVAVALGVSTDTLARWETRRDGPPCIRIGRKVLYRTEAVREWLVSREGPGGQPKARSGGRK